MARPSGRPESTTPDSSRLHGVAGLEEARSSLLRLANNADQHVAVAMLAEALVQIERIGPRVSGEAWEAYLAVERAAKPSEPAAI